MALFSRLQEWEDALIKHKVMDAPLDHAKMKFMLEQKRSDDEFLGSKRDDNQDLNLDELGDAFEEDDDFDTNMFEKYRAARLAEMKAEQAKVFSRIAVP